MTPHDIETAIDGETVPDAEDRGRLQMGHDDEHDKLHDFATRYANAWCGQRPEDVAAFFSENGSLSVNDGEPAIGRSAIARVALGFMTAFPDMVVSMDELVTEARGTVFHWTLAGTNTGPDGSGKRVRLSGFEVWQLGADGLISESRGHFDAAEYERQLAEGIDGD